MIENLPIERGSISWQVVPSNRFPQGLADLTEAVKEDGAWVAVVGV